MIVLHTYLTFLGNCEEAFNFYKEVFGGEFAMISRFREMPPQDGVELSDEDLDKIMHVTLPIGEHSVLMGSDSGGEWSSGVVVGNNFSVSVNVDTKEQADSLFEKLAENGKVTMPIADTFWGSYFGMCMDKFDINWMVSYSEQ